MCVCVCVRVLREESSREMSREDVCVASVCVCCECVCVLRVWVRSCPPEVHRVRLVLWGPGARWFLGYWVGRGPMMAQ